MYVGLLLEQSFTVLPCLESLFSLGHLELPLSRKAPGKANGEVEDMLKLMNTLGCAATR